MEETNEILESLHKVKEYCDGKISCAGCYFSLLGHGCAFIDGLPCYWKLPEEGEADNA